MPGKGWPREHSERFGSDLRYSGLPALRRYFDHSGLRPWDQPAAVQI